MDRIICGLFLESDEKNFFILKNKQVETLQHYDLKRSYSSKKFMDNAYWKQHVRIAWPLDQ